MKTVTGKKESDELLKARISKDTADMMMVEGEAGSRFVKFKDDVDDFDEPLWPVWSLGRLIDMLPRTYTGTNAEFMILRKESVGYMWPGTKDDWYIEYSGSSDLLENLVGLICNIRRRCPL